MALSGIGNTKGEAFAVHCGHRQLCHRVHDDRLRDRAADGSERPGRHHGLDACLCGCAGDGHRRQGPRGDAESAEDQDRRRKPGVRRIRADLGRAGLGGRCPSQQDRVRRREGLTDEPAGPRHGNRGARPEHVRPVARPIPQRRRTGLHGEHPLGCLPPGGLRRHEAGTQHRERVLARRQPHPVVRSADRRRSAVARDRPRPVPVGADRGAPLERATTEAPEGPQESEDAPAAAPSDLQADRSAGYCGPKGPPLDRPHGCRGAGDSRGDPGHAAGAGHPRAGRRLDEGQSL